MRSSPFTVFVVVCLLLASGAELQEPYRVYRSERVVLDVDAHRMLVRANGSLAPQLMDVVDDAPIAVPGWRMVTFAAPAAGPHAVRGRIDRVLGCAGVAFASPVFHGFDDGWFAVTPGVLVRWAEGRRHHAMQWPSHRDDADVVERRFGGMDGALHLRARSRDGLAVLAFANRLAEDADVEWAEPDWLFTGGGGHIPNDPGVPQLWGMINTGQNNGVADMDMDADLAWDLTTGSPSVRVLVIDTGVEPGHPDLNVQPGVDVTSQTGNLGAPVNACDNHGTPVAGCVTAKIDNHLGTVGIAPNCVSVSARTFISRSSCSGGWSSQSSWTVNALAWGQRNGIRITNNSNYYGSSSSAIDAQYAATRQAGMIHFAIAGNFSRNRVEYPGSSPAVNAVSAVDRTGGLASFSSFGNAIEYSAPGAAIYTTDRTGAAGWQPGDYTTSNGTSFATPYTAGVAALILSRRPNATVREVELSLRAGRDRGQPGWDRSFGWAFVNANAALRTAPYGTGLAGTGAVVPELFAVGTMRIGTTVAMHVEAARGGALSWVVLGSGRAQMPLLGGTVWIAPPYAPLPLALGGTGGVAGAGNGRLPIALPNASALIGAKARLQAAIADAGAIAGVALTNAIEIEISG